VLLVFGLGMFLLGKRGMRSAKREHAARSSESSLNK